MPAAGKKAPRPAVSRHGPSGWRASLLLSAGSLLFFLALIEFGVRVAAPDLSLPQSEQHFRFTQSFEFELPHHERDSRLGWRLKPGTYGNMNVNSDGFRGAEFSRTRQAMRRIAHLGDSSTMGFTIADDRQVYGARVAALLSRRDVPTETLNFGVDGYSSHQGCLVLDDALEYEPDYVTLYFGYNDHHYSNASDRDTRYADPSYRRLLEKSDAYRFMRRHLLRLTRREARLADPERRVDLDAYEENLRDMVRRVRASGAAPILMTTPLRPFAPLTANEVPIEVDGERVWVTQDWWVRDQLQQRGVEFEKASGTEAMRDVLAQGLAQYPEWPYLHFLHARELRDAQRPEASQAALGRAMQFDAERHVMEAYAERVRRVAAELDVELIDLARIFATRRQLLFNDVVHPNVQGHGLIAGQIVAAILRLEGVSTDPNSP